MVASAVQLAKRALVSLVKAMAVQYHVIVMLNRDSPDAEVTRAFKKVALKAHPDKGGSTEDFRKLSEARESWEDCKAGKRASAPQQQDGQGGSASAGCDLSATSSGKRGFRVQSSAVLLTFSGIKDLTH